MNLWRLYEVACEAGTGVGEGNRPVGRILFARRKPRVTTIRLGDRLPESL